MVSNILKRLQEIDMLIREFRTGTPVELAKKIGVSERTIYQYIKVMKGLGAPIDFNNLAKTYYYKEEGRLILSFSLVQSDRLKNVEPDTKPRMISMEEFVEEMNKHIVLNNN